MPELHDLVDLEHTFAALEARADAYPLRDLAGPGFPRPKTSHHTGLILAAELNRHGVTCRIIDKAEGSTSLLPAASPFVKKEIFKKGYAELNSCSISSTVLLDCNRIFISHGLT